MYEREEHENKRKCVVQEICQLMQRKCVIMRQRELGWKRKTWIENKKLKNFGLNFLRSANLNCAASSTCEGRRRGRSGRRH